MEFNIKNFYNENSVRDDLKKPFFNNTKSVLYAANLFMCIKIPKGSDLFDIELGYEIIDERGLIMKIETLFSRWLNIADYQIITDFPLNNERKICLSCNGSGIHECECSFCKGHKCEKCEGEGSVLVNNEITLGKWKRKFNQVFISHILNLPNVKVFDTVHPDNLNMPYLDPIYFSFGPESECKGLLMGMRP